MNLKCTALCLASLLAVSAAQADTSGYSGSLAGASPTFHRPYELDLLSGVGTNVFYDAHAFTVTASGSYDFLTTSVGYDSFLALYQGSFDPASGLTNLVALNDDFDGFTTSGFTYSLTAGAIYVLVNTSFENEEVGSFTQTLTGPGVIAAVPEPGSYALLALGLGVLAAAARRSSRRAA